MGTWEAEIRLNGVEKATLNYLDTYHSGLGGFVGKLKKYGCVNVDELPGCMQRKLISMLARAGYEWCYLRFNELHLCAYKYERKNVRTYKTPAGSRIEILQEGSEKIARLLSVISDADFTTFLRVLEHEKCDTVWSGDNAKVYTWLCDNGYSATGLKGVVRRGCNIES